MAPRMKNGTMAGLAILAFLLGFSIQPAYAFNVSYRLDKQYYYPGDMGLLQLNYKNDDAYDVFLFAAEMKIVGIGVFKWEANLPEAPNLPPNVHAYLVKKDQTVSIEIGFKIPLGTRPGEYEYTWTITAGPAPFSPTPYVKTDRLRVLAVGEKPPPEPFNPLLLVSIAIPVLLLAYPLARWKSKKTAGIIGISIVALFVLGFALGGFLFVFLAFSFVTAFYPYLILLVLAMVTGLIILRRRRKGVMKEHRTTSAPAPFACPHCRKDLPTLPKDIAVCPYCGGKLAQRACLGCGRDLSQLPDDIENCPYCGRAVHLQEAKAEPGKAQRIGRYAKIMTFLSLLFTGVSFIYAQLFAGGWSGPELPLGVLIVVISAIIWTIATAITRKKK